MNIYLTIGLLLASILTTLVLIGIVAFFKVKRSFVSFITPEKEGELSPAAQVMDAASIMIARALVAQLKTTLMGMESGAVRAERAAAGEMAVDAAGSTPLGAALTQIPAVRKTLKRNPALLDLALNYLSRQDQQPGPRTPVSAGSNGHSQMKFKL